MQQVKAAYKMRQIDLYTVATSIANSTNTLLTDFTAFRSNYNAAFITALNAQISVTKAIPDFQARNKAAEILRNELEKTLKPAIQNLWQRLKRYITYTSPAMNHQAEWDAAGFKYYQEASQSNWDAMEQLCQSAQNYLTANAAALTAAGMPAAFSTDFDAAYAQFATAHSQFISERQAASVATENKIAANNELFQAVSKICADAKTIFTDSPAALRQFTISHIMDMITGAGQSGIKGTAIDQATGKTLAGATIEVIETGDIVTTDADGNYELKLPSGTYNIVAQYEPITASASLRLTTQIKVIKGTISTYKFELMSSLEEDAIKTA